MIEQKAKELENQEEATNESTAVLKSSEKFKSLDLLRKELLVKAHDKNEAQAQGKVMVNIVKDKGEVLLSTSYEALHKHGYKPFMRWGVLKETLTAACLLESGILERANRTGKLHLWDPFCGSGSFLIESLMMLLNRPCRSLDEPMPF
jgi:putative N6-adenine-specific DNA methylase